MSSLNAFPSDPFLAGPRPERVRDDETLEDVVFLDARMILELRLVFPVAANDKDFKRIEGFRWKSGGRPVTFATTPYEEIVLDDFKNRGGNPDFGHFLRASTGVGVVSSFDRMRERDFGVQNFHMSDVGQHTLACLNLVRQ